MALSSFVARGSGDTADTGATRALSGLAEELQLGLRGVEVDDCNCVALPRVTLACIATAYGAQPPISLDLHALDEGADECDSASSASSEGSTNVPIEVAVLK